MHIPKKCKVCTESCKGSRCDKVLGIHNDKFVVFSAKKGKQIRHSERVREYREMAVMKFN